MMTRNSRTIPALFLATAAVMFPMLASPAIAANTTSIVLLGTHLQNDNEMYEPTSDAERARLAKLGEAFTTQLGNSGQYDVKTVPPDMGSKISAGQTLGECSGCEVEYGAALGVDQVAWINVQKVSNLILNLNIYLADVKTKKMTFVRSVDIRGNTDEGWSRALTNLVKNYLLPGRG